MSNAKKFEGVYKDPIVFRPGKVAFCGEGVNDDGTPKGTYEVKVVFTKEIQDEFKADPTIKGFSVSEVKKLDDEYSKHPVFKGALEYKMLKKPSDSMVSEYTDANGTVWPAICSPDDFVIKIRTRIQNLPTLKFYDESKNPLEFTVDSLNPGDIVQVKATPCLIPKEGRKKASIALYLDAVKLVRKRKQVSRETSIDEFTEVTESDTVPDFETEELAF